MPTVDENLRQWSEYDWSAGGDEWSEVWGGSASVWYGSLLPRIHEALAHAETVVEIAPGYGRITQYLRRHCRRLILVDLTPRCIDACRERFREDGHLEYHVNDGRTLPMLEDGSVGLAFSFDSLVHVEIDVITGYLKHLGRALAPDGLGFFHHSNVGAYVDATSGRLSIENSHWRGESVSAEAFRRVCERYGLTCLSQELVNWGGSPHLTDCFSLFARADSRFARPLQLLENPRFMDEAVNLGRVRPLYRLEPSG